MHRFEGGILRTGPNNEFSLFATLSDGRQVRILYGGEDWFTTGIVSACKEHLEWETVKTINDLLAFVREILEDK